MSKKLSNFLKAFKDLSDHEKDELIEFFKIYDNTLYGFQKEELINYTIQRLHSLGPMSDDVCPYCGK